MPAPIIPWLPSNIPTEIQSELNRRKTVRGLNFVRGNTASWDDKNGDWVNYKGPMTAWVRACSNGLGKPESREKNGIPIPATDQEFRRSGFVMYGGKDFYSTYGFLNPDQGRGGLSILGYTPNGVPHELDYSVSTSKYPIHVPNPEISKIDMVIQKELFRRATIQWTCFSWKQLEYMTPYFLVPGITVILEFGWNHFNPSSLLDLRDENNLVKLWENPYPLYSNNILKSNGNYDVIWGIITNFNWSVEGGLIRCSTEITSKDRIYSGISVSSNAISNDLSIKKNTKIEQEANLPSMFINLTRMCDGNFLNALRTIAETKERDVLDVSLEKYGGADDLKRLCKKLSVEGREHYWRGVFWGRNNDDKHRLNIGRRGEDFDKHTKDTENMWVNLGFITEIMNFCLPIPDVGESGKSFFEVDVDDCIIGGHLNLISPDPRILIPNAMAPKYNWSLRGPVVPSDKPMWDSINSKPKIKIDPTSPPKDSVSATKWYADIQLSKIFYHGLSPMRDNIDQIINWVRHDFVDSSGPFCFPFIDSEQHDSENVNMKYLPYRYGRYRDIYFNINTFVEIIKNLLKDSAKPPTYESVYSEIFRVLKECSGGFWDLRLVDSTGKRNGIRATMKIADEKMVPIRNDDDKVYYFDYFEADSVIQNIAFKPALTNAQATRVIFAETNNPNAKVILKSESDLLDYQFKDRILIRKDKKDPSEVINDEANKRNKTISEDREKLQTLSSPGGDRFPITFDESPAPPQPSLDINALTAAARASGGTISAIVPRVPSTSSSPSSSKMNYINLILPNMTFMELLLADDDVNFNSRYFGVQPNITMEMTLQGIGGIRTFQMFLVRNLPEPYSDKNVIFRVVDVEQNIENGKWETIVRAGLLPLRDAIKKQLGIET